MRFQAVFFATLTVLTTRYVVFGLVSQTEYLFNGYQNTYFELYTPDSPDNPLVLNMNNASSITMYQSYDGTLPMRVVIAGWYHTDERARMFFQKYFECGQTNLVYVNWMKGSNTYVSALSSLNVRTAGKALADFLSLVEVQTGLDMSKVSMVGEGLGAGVAGEASRRLANVSSILALDPTWTIYSRTLSRDDATYVQAIHTNALMGTYWRVADADFFVNGLIRQPGCSWFNLKCSHLYAAVVFYRSLCDSKITGCRIGHSGDCGYVMGGNTLHIYSGEFEVKTTE